MDKNIEQAGFAEPHSSLTIGWVGVGLGRSWAGDGVGLGLKFGSLTSGNLPCAK